MTDEATNVCEHGDHAAPPGKRFCSPECCECEHADFDETQGTCAGRCKTTAQCPICGDWDAEPCCPAHEYVVELRDTIKAITATVAAHETLQGLDLEGVQEIKQHVAALEHTI